MVIAMSAFDRGGLRATRNGLALLAALGVGATLAGCGTSAEVTPAGPVASQPPAAEPSPAPYDISRVDAVSNDFPQGFTPQAHPAKTLGQSDIDGSAVAAFTDAQVDPPQCRSVVIPPYVDPTVGTEAAGVIGQETRATCTSSPCGRRILLRLSLNRRAVTGSRCPVRRRRPGPWSVSRHPPFLSATTTGVKLSVADPEEDPDYLYTAALDQRTSVVVMGSADAQLDPQRLMSDLLVKAVSAVRGQQQP